MGLFARDGHILDLGLERYLAEELSASEGEALEAHLSVCAACQARVEHLRLPMSALPPLSDTLPSPQHTELITPLYQR
jgi:anti-sigma factor RsiW